MRFAAVPLLALALLLSGCDRVGWSPSETRAGWRLPGPSETRPVTDWSFTDSINQAQLETRAWWGWHSVTVWTVSIDGRLFIATDFRARPKRWVANVDADPRARIGLGGKIYPVRLSRVTDPVLWDRITSRYPEKYARELAAYGEVLDFPKPGEPRTGDVFELVSAP
jgi:hypothetical protein